MPAANLKLANDVTQIAFKAFCSVLSSDPVLRQLGARIYTWEDDVSSLPPTKVKLPYLLVTPSPDRSGWYDNYDHSEPMLVSLQCAVDGVNVDDSLNFWGAVRSALFPADPTQRAKVVAGLQDGGISRVEILRPSYGIQDTAAPSDTKTIVSPPGQVKLGLFVSTIPR